MDFEKSYIKISIFYTYTLPSKKCIKGLTFSLWALQVNEIVDKILKS